MISLRFEVEGTVMSLASVAHHDVGAGTGVGEGLEDFGVAVASGSIADADDHPIYSASHDLRGVGNRLEVSDGVAELRFNLASAAIDVVAHLIIDLLASRVSTAHHFMSSKFFNYLFFNQTRSNQCCLERTKKKKSLCVKVKTKKTTLYLNFQKDRKSQEMRLHLIRH